MRSTERFPKMALSNCVLSEHKSDLFDAWLVAQDRVFTQFHMKCGWSVMWCVQCAAALTSSQKDKVVQLLIIVNCIGEITNFACSLFAILTACSYSVATSIIVLFKLMQVLAIDVCLCAPYSYLIDFFVNFRSFNSFQWALILLGHFQNEEFIFDLFTIFFWLHQSSHFTSNP